ncbi:ccr4-not transcription complex [Holotrichia oblita]|uniref:Ccr4-not transcription complex n=1 Tax=Holotrichia oblita TaxID=644536 RepID=A0ACB9TS96_HOLOL|nr:ccr4-not transcription complex [Holotrichia oblita]
MQFSFSQTLKVGSQFFQQLCKCLRLSPVQEVVFALALCHSSNEELVTCSQNHLRHCVPVLVKSYIDTEGSSSQHAGGLHETTPEVLHLILSVILKSPKEVGLTNDIHTTFLNTLKKDFPKDIVPVVLAPLVYPEECEIAPEMSSEGPGLTGGMLDTSLSEMIRELGYGFTSSVDECRNTLLKLVGRDIASMHVSRILSVMCQQNSSFEESLNIQQPGSFNKSLEGRTWNVDVFVQALKEISPNLQWGSVIRELDNPNFVIKDRTGLCTLISALKMGLQNNGFYPETFPVDHLYRRWNNYEGQFSLIQHILKNPDVFCFLDYPCTTVSVDMLKTPPEQDSKELDNWRSLSLIELLLQLSECNNLYRPVSELFNVPMQSCPDVLVLALLQIHGSVTILRQELLTNLIPIFLGNHPNSAVILHHAWHTQTLNFKSIIMHSMAQWYTGGGGDHDQTKLSRILDVAQDLKALSMLLNAQSAQSYPFIIDLACLASRREYLKLEKWLTDKIREHGENFVMACIKFLHRRCPQLLAGVKNRRQSDQDSPLPTETLSTIMMCLQSCGGSFSGECQDAILNLTSSCTIYLKARQQPSTLIRSHRAMDGPFNPTTIGQLYNPSSVDPIAGIGTSLANMNLGGPANTAFNLQGGLGQLVPSPGSPSRILAGPGPSNSPFPMMPLQHQGPVGTGASLVSNVNSIGNINRMGPNPALDKPRIPETSLFPDMLNVSKDIEDEANSYFQRIYNHPPHPTLTIDEVLDMLKRFQDSPVKRERDVFNCMLRNLFEEYRFFPQYPDKELYITAQLFGGIIERGLVPSYVYQGLALRFVLEALRKSEGSKMYYFGIVALDRFKSRLKDYHKYCEHVRAIPHFNEFPPHLIEYVEYGLQSAEPPSKPQGSVLPASLGAMLTPINNNAGTPVYKSNSSACLSSKTSTTSATSLGTRPSIANATNIDTLLVATEKDEITTPPESLIDKTAFIFNNLSQLNLQTKCDELRDIVSDEFWPWISQYLVMKRASIELNFHALYSNFLDVLKVPDVNRMVTKETYRNIKVLLRADKVIANFSDRSLLKNLGHWLGMLTLARNKPILQNDLDLKSLLVEAYYKGQQELLYVVPFVAKILESCAKSKVFKPPNPWTMAIMNVLAELHQEPELKLNLKFEIEVLCKNLDIDVSQLKPSVYLKDPERLRKIEYQLSQPPKKDNSQVAVSQLNIPTTSLNEPELTGVPGQTASSPPVMQNNSTTPTSSVAAPEPRFSYMDIQLAGSAALQNHLTINPSILLFQSQPQLKQLVRTAVERAVNEWVLPVAERAIKIALQTCEHIIRKDFALDFEENRMRMAAHYMVRNLTAGMAMITCRDQLLASITTQMKGTLQNAMVGATVPQKEMIDQAATIIAQENMELGCAFIQKTAIEKAIPEIDKRLLSEYELRKIARQEGR